MRRYRYRIALRSGTTSGSDWLVKSVWCCCYLQLEAMKDTSEVDTNGTELS